MIRPWCLEDKSFAKVTLLLLLLRSVSGQWSAFMKLLAILNSWCPPKPTTKFCQHAALNRHFVAVTHNPCCFQRTTTACYLLAGISRRQGHTQYCHGVILHQFHWACSEGVLTLIGCWAVITTSNNDRYFKENRENWTQENRQWLLFFLGILFSIFWYFLTIQLCFMPVYVLRIHSSYDLCQSKFFMMPGFGYVRRHFALWRSVNCDMSRRDPRLQI